MDPQDDWETMAQVQQKSLLLKSRAIETVLAQLMLAPLR